MQPVAPIPEALQQRDVKSIGACPPLGARTQRSRSRKTARGSGTASGSGGGGGGANGGVRACGR